MMRKMFSEFWAEIIHETDFGEKFKKNNISLHFRISEPEMDMFLDENGPLFNEEVKEKTPVITMSLNADSLHDFLLDHLDIPKALPKGRSEKSFRRYQF